LKANSKDTPQGLADPSPASRRRCAIAPNRRSAQAVQPEAMEEPSAARFWHRRTPRQSLLAVRSTMAEKPPRRCRSRIGPATTATRSQRSLRSEEPWHLARPAISMRWGSLRLARRDPIEEETNER